MSLASCGAEPDGASARPAEAAASTGMPWETLPADSIYGASPVENLVVRQVELDLAGIPAGWEGMKIAAISDLQLGLWEGNREVAGAAVTRALAQQPDLVVLLGDLLGAGRDTAQLSQTLAPLRGRPALAVLGDRDTRTDSLEAAVERTLAGLGIRVLKNGSVPFVHGGDTAAIAGVDPGLASMPEGDQLWVLGQLGSGRLGLLLAHSPALAARAPRGRFPGALAGGTFCGRIEVPGTTRLSWLADGPLSDAGTPGLPQIFRLGRTVLYVTCGTGYGFVPIRYGAAPEVSLITLRDTGRRAAAGPDPAQDTTSIDTLIERYQRTDTTTAAEPG